MPPIHASRKAEEIIESLCIRFPSEISIKDIAMERGAFVRERSLRGSEARLILKGNLGIISVNSTIPEQGRKRFAIAHEIGHLELHRSTQLIICSEQDMNVWNESSRREREANDFAASMLMPENLLKRYVGRDQPTMGIIRDIASKFRTSLTATALRYVHLSFEPCAIVISKGGIIKWYKKSNSFAFHVKVGEKLSPDSYAFDFYHNKDLPEKPQRTPACAWLAGRINDEADIFEHSFALKNYGVVLSLLWVYDDICFDYQRSYEDDETEFDLTNPFRPDGKRWRW